MIAFILVLPMVLLSLMITLSFSAAVLTVVCGGVSRFVKSTAQQWRKTMAGY